jgi:hypothetical protein
MCAAQSPTAPRRRRRNFTISRTIKSQPLTQAYTSSIALALLTKDATVAVNLITPVDLKARL